MAWKPKSYKHKLAVMGDSMAQGFNNGGVYRTDLNFPALLSRCFEPPIRFDQPSFTAQAGIPLNIEVLVRGLSEKIGDDITMTEYLKAGTYMYRTLRRIKSYWEGRMKPLKIERDAPYHNQSVWGFAANDTWLLTEKACKQYLEENQNRYSIFSVLPDNAMYITGRLVLNPSHNPLFETHNQIDNIRWLHDHGGIENLIVCVGHNNFVKALSELKIIYSSPEDLTEPPFNRNYTVYRPEHFEKEMRTLYEKVGSMGIPRVFVPTYPYITIPPATRGINIIPDPDHSGYFDYYTRFWIWDEDFNPEKHPHFTKEEAIKLDQIADRYNQIIRELSDEFGFITVPVNRYVNAVARRRSGLNAVRPYPPEFIEALKRNHMTSHLVDEDGSVHLSTDYLRVSEETGKIYQGGIFSLDGLHPTTIGYGLIANIYRMSMQQSGVKFDRPIDWDFIIENDTLVSDPPYLLTELRLLLRFLSLGRQEKFTKFSQSVLQQLVEIFTMRKEKI